MIKFHKSGLLTKIRNILLIAVLAAWQVAFAGAPLLTSNSAHAAPITDPSKCINDTAGANDEPGQKDLTQLCIDTSTATSQHVTWNWDELGTTGANTLDGCALFDTDGDGNINYSVCVTTTGNPATLQSTSLYSCGDDKIDRCTSPVTALAISHNTTCSLFAATDPFPDGDSAPKDTGADCNLVFADVGGASVAQLVDVCSYPSQQPNSDPSDCVIIQPKSGKLEVKKHLVPATDSGLFNLQIDSVTKAANVGDNGTTGEVIEPSGNNGTSYTVGETAGTNSSLSNYSTSIECRDQNGTGDVVGSGNTTSTSVTVNDGDDTVCVITNTVNQATLVLQKTVVNDNGGTLTQSDFPVAIDGTAAQWGSNSVSPGTYTVSETQQTGYQAGSWGGDCTAGGSVTLTPGQTATCSITNDDIAPQLTVIKHVINDNGGTAAASSFTINMTGTNVSDTSFAGAESPGTTVTLNAGSYSVDENAAAGYSKTLGTDCSGTIAIGETKTCTITNDDIAPSLTVTKVVVNPYGTALDPSAFPLFVDGISVTSGVATTQFDAGSHTVTETQQSGYTLTSVSGNCTQTNNTISLTLSIGGTSTCTLTNTAIQPRLTVIKHVVNDNGGGKTASDFTMSVTGTNVSSPSFAGAESPGTTITLNEGSYSVDEGSHVGYTETTSGDCDSTIAIGQTKTCTITNNDIAPTLKLVKIVTNTNGGTKTAADWTLTASGSGGFSDTGDSTTFHSVTANINYALSESTVPGYAAGSWSCDGGSQVGSNIALSPGQNVTCTITNSDVAATLTLVKTVVDNNGGTKTVNDFQGKIDGNNVAWATAISLSAGAHTASEVNLPGYSAGSWGGDCAADGSIILANAQNATCTITNDDVAPSLTLNKIVSNTHGGTAVESDWTLSATGPTNLSGPGAAGSTDVVSGSTFSAGTYTLSESGSPSGYSASDWTCSNNVTVSNHQITLANGQTTVCNITNSDVAPQLTVIKHVINDNSGTSDASDFTINVSGSNVSDSSFPGAENPGTTVTLNAGSYSVDENSSADYTRTLSADCTGDIQVGQAKTCIVTNNDIAHPSIHVVKSGPGSASAGNTVTYTFTVTNTGDIALSDLTVQDNIAGTGVYQSGDTNNDSFLDMTETWIYTAQYAIPANQVNSVVNTVTACGAFDTEFNNELNIDRIDGGVSQTVCSQDSHTLVIPKVLAEVTPPQLVNTGQPAILSIIAGLLALSTVAGLSFATRQNKR